MSYARRSARVLLLDDRDRILLFRFLWQAKRPELGHLWVTPGGGVDEGEELRAAAVRELREETGLDLPPGTSLPHVAYSEGHAEFDWARGLFRDDYFYHRTTAHTVDESGQEEMERSTMLGYHWWTLDELRASSDFIVPFGLCELLEDLLAGKLPETAQQVQWHH